MTTYEHWNIDNLKNHHLNAEVFGQLSVDADCSEFVESIKRNGVLQPLLVVSDGPKLNSGTIIAGHRRMQGAALAGLNEVPVVVRRDVIDQIDIDRLWFETNRNREMTTEQKARWFKKREAIEAAAAKKRQSAAGGSAPVKCDLSARAADVAARDVGLSRNTAKAAAKVVDAIDKAEAKGDKATAGKLRETLNSKSVSAAKREADKAAGKPETNAKSFDTDKHFKSIGAIMRALDDVKAKHGAIQEYKTAMQAARELHNAIDALDLRLQK